MLLSFNVLYIFLPSERVLGITEGMENLGGMQWELFGTLILGWIVVYLIIWKGLHSSGKVTLAWDGKTCTDHDIYVTIFLCISTISSLSFHMIDYLVHRIVSIFRHVRAIGEIGNITRCFYRTLEGKLILVR